MVDALVSMDFMSEAAARNWCEKAVEPYTISIEDFAKRVKSYICLLYTSLSSAPSFVTNTNGRWIL